MLSSLLVVIAAGFAEPPTFVADTVRTDRPSGALVRLDADGSAQQQTANARGVKKIDAAASHFSPRRFTSPLACETMRGRARHELPLDRHHWETPNSFRLPSSSGASARLAEFREVLDDGVLP